MLDGPQKASESCPGEVEGSATGVGNGSPRGDCAEDTPFDSCRRPCYVDVQGAADGQIQVSRLNPGARDTK